MTKRHSSNWSKGPQLRQQLPFETLCGWLLFNYILIIMKMAFLSSMQKCSTSCFLVTARIRGSAARHQPSCQSLSRWVSTRRESHKVCRELDSSEHSRMVKRCFRHTCLIRDTKCVIMTAPCFLLSLRHSSTDNMLHQANELFWLPGNKMENSKERNAGFNKTKSKPVPTARSKEVAENKTGWGMSTLVWVTWCLRPTIGCSVVSREESSWLQQRGHSGRFLSCSMYEKLLDLKEKAGWAQPGSNRKMKLMQKCCNLRSSNWPVRGDFTGG